MQKSRNNEWQTTGRNRRNRRNRNSYKSTSWEKTPTRKTQTNEEPQKHPYIPKQVPIKKEPSGPNYASIISKNDDKSSLADASEYTNDTESTTIVPVIIQNIFGTKTQVRNRIPQRNCNSSYDVWEHTYFRHILDLKDIFSQRAAKLNIETDSVDFLNIFSQFIRDCSSGEISPYVEDLTEDENEYYLDFTILRNEI
jgi:hypothetical protein